MNTAEVSQGIAGTLKDDFYGPGKKADTVAGKLLARWLLSRKRFQAESIDSGYDVSSFPRATDQSFQLSDYTTVESFLAEPSGQTVATYLAGAGLATETLEEVFDAELSLMRSHNLLVDDEVFDEVVEALNDDDELANVRLEWLETFFQRPLDEVIAPYWASTQDQLITEAAHAQAAAQLNKAQRQHLETLGARAQNRLKEAGVQVESSYDMGKKHKLETLMRQLEALGADGHELHAFVITRLYDHLSNKLYALTLQNYPDLQN